jgi:N-acetylglucosamine kinase-like BadF-type ATPase
MPARQIVIGIDGGGTYTRACAADLQGNVLAQVQVGGANPSKNPDAEQNIRFAISECLHIAEAAMPQVAALVVGYSWPGCTRRSSLGRAIRLSTRPVGQAYLCQRCRCRLGRCAWVRAGHRCHRGHRLDHFRRYIRRPPRAQL